MPTFSRASHPVSWLSSGASGACGEWNLDAKKIVSIPSCQLVDSGGFRSLWRIDFTCQNFREHSVLSTCWFQRLQEFVENGFWMSKFSKAFRLDCWLNWEASGACGDWILDADIFREHSVLSVG